MKFIGVLVVNVAATALVVSMLSNSVKTITESAAQLFRPLTATYAEGAFLRVGLQQAISH